MEKDGTGSCLGCEFGSHWLTKVCALLRLGPSNRIGIILRVKQLSCKLSLQGFSLGGFGFEMGRKGGFRVFFKFLVRTRSSRRLRR